VTKHFLHSAKIGATLQNVGGRRVPQRMGGERGTASLLREFVNNISNRTLIQSSATCTNEERLLPWIGRHETADGKPILQGSSGRHPEWNHPLLSPLTQDAKSKTRCIDVGQVNSAQFTDPATSCVQHLDDGAISDGKW